MKKITLSLILLFSFTYGISQTSIVVVDEGVVPNNFFFCFNDDCTATSAANDEVSNENPSSGNVIELDYTTATFLGAGIDFAGFVSPSIDANGSYASVLFRSVTNLSGEVPVTLQLWVSDDDKRDAYATYTKTDGTWQKLIFDFSEGAGEVFGTFTNASVFTRINIFPNSGNDAEPSTYQFDEVVLDQVLSTEDFAKGSGVKVYLSENGNRLNVKGDIKGETLRLFDFSGRLLKSKPVKKSRNSMEVSALSSGVYFLNTERGSTKFIIGRK